MSRTFTARAGRPPIFADVALASALLIAPATLVRAQTASPDVAVRVFADRYVLTGLAIDDLDVVENAVVPLRPRAVRLDACGIAADLPQRAAAHRFRHLELELRMLEPAVPECRHAADLHERARRRGQGPSGIDEEAVNRWWHESMP
jgi:hypothetical protein